MRRLISLLFASVLLVVGVPAAGATATGTLQSISSRRQSGPMGQWPTRSPTLCSHSSIAILR